MTHRFPELDFIRGIAILGILFLNIRLFALGVYAYASPLNVGATHFSDRMIFYVVDVLFNGKYIAMFCLLFGMSIVILSNRYVDHISGHVIRNRMLCLFLIGLLHGYLLFSGDILVSYAICGMIAFLAYSWRAKTLIIVGSSVYCVSFLIHIYFFFHFRANEGDLNWYASPDTLAVLAQNYLGSFADQIKIRFASTFYVETSLFAKDYFWRTLGLMWVGMGMYKQSWMTRVTHWPLYLSLSVLCIGLSTVVTLLNIHWHWDARFSQYLGLPLLHLISFPQALTYMLLLICVYRRLTHSRIFSMFINVGRMSLTAYLLESVFAHVIFYGHHGYYGQFSYAQQIPIVILISIVIMGFAQYWMYYFQRGPMEFLLHSYSGIPDE